MMMVMVMKMEVENDSKKKFRCSRNGGWGVGVIGNRRG